MLDKDLHYMFRKSVSSSVFPFNFWAYHLCLNLLLFCRSCLGELVPRETGRKPACMPRPMRAILLTMRLLQLVSKRLRFSRATLTARRRILDLPAVYL